MSENTPKNNDHTSETQGSLRQLVEEVRTSGAIEGPTMQESLERRRQTGELLTEDDLRNEIAVIEDNIDSLKYSSALERTMYYTVLERMRIRLEMRHGRIDTTDPQDQHSLEVLKDLGRRITYAQYEEAAVDEILDAAEDYENYRAEFHLDRLPEDGGVPRNPALETQLRAQLLTLHALLPKMADMRKLRFYEFQESSAPGDRNIAQNVEALRSQIPTKYDGNSKAYYDVLEQELRSILGESSPEIRKEHRMTPIAHELHRDAIERHFDVILSRRNSLIGRTGSDAEASKESLKNEHVLLLDHALNYNVQSLSHLTATIALLSREGHFDQPIVDPDAISTKEQGFGILGDREAIARERDRKIADIDTYIQHFRENVLRENHSIDVPLVGNVPLDPTLIMEDIMTTNVIPLKLQLAEPIARGATIPWSVQDSLLSSVGLHWDIRERRTQAILKPIYDRLGLPENYSELAPDQQADARNTPVVQERLRSVKTIIDEFRSQEGSVLDGMQSDIDLLRQLIAIHPSESLVLAMEPKVLSQMPDLSSLKTNEDIAGAYIFLLERIGTKRVADMNSAQRNFIRKVNENLSLNIDIADIEKQLASAWIEEWSKSIGLLLGEGLSAYILLRRGVPAAIRYAPGILRAAGTQVVRGARSGVDGLRSASRIARSSSSEVMKGVPKSTVARRVLGPIGIVLVGAELRSVLQRDSRLQELSELDAIDAAIELMEKKGDRLALRYTTELSYLHNRREAFRMQQNALQLLSELGKRYPDNSNKAANVLKDRCEEIEKFARAHKVENEKLFPITGYLMTDPQRDEGNVGVNIRDIDQARLRGMRHEIDRGKKIDFSSFGKRLDDFKNPLHAIEVLGKPRIADPEHNLADLTAAHDALLDDVANVLGE